MAKNDEKRPKTGLFGTKEGKCPTCSDNLAFLMTELDRAHKMAIKVALNHICVMHNYWAIEGENSRIVIKITK